MMRRMRDAFALPLLLLCATLPALAAQAGQKAARAVEEVRKVERAWLDAYENWDVEAMERIVGEDFSITFPGGQVQTRAQLIAMTKAGRAGRQPAPRVRTEDVRGRAYGDTVILTGRVILEEQRGGKVVVEESRYTDTYVKVKGRWQVVASHLSNVARPAARD